METNFAKIRQRLVGSLVLLLVIVLIVLLLLFASKHGSNKMADDQAAARDLSAQPDVALVQLPATSPDDNGRAATAATVPLTVKNSVAAMTNGAPVVAAAPSANAAVLVAPNNAASAVPSTASSAKPGVPVAGSAGANSPAPLPASVTPSMSNTVSQNSPGAANAQLLAPAVPANQDVSSAATNAAPGTEVSSDQFGQVSPAKATSVKLPVKKVATKNTVKKWTKKTAVAKTAPTAKHSIKSTAKTVAAKPAVAKTATHAAATAPISGWIVKLGSFASPLRAATLSKELRAKGYKAHTALQSTSKGVLTQVFVGPEATKESAQKLATKIATSCKMKGQVVKK